MVAVAAALLASGCLSTTHVIPRGELEALARRPPEARGQRVRVLQGFEGDDEPPPAPAVGSNTSVVVGVSVPLPVPGPAIGHGGGLGSAKAEKARWWLVVAAVTAVGLAATEGARYDGWVALHPMHPVHLYGPGGEYAWRPLAQIDPQTAAWARKAFVREGEGPWTRLARAPLDRRGLTYSMLVGVARLPSADGSEDRGFLGHIQVGGFPGQGVGVLLDVAMGWRATASGRTVYDTRTAGELELLPVQAGILHLGAFGQAGFATRFEDGLKSGDNSVLFGGGALLQLELTTRLAVTGRAGVSFVHDESASEITVGVSIY